jgi:hypothetical protein
MSKKRFRVGTKVQSVFDPTHVFIIDKSQVPERIYHEKGSDRWWTRNELQRLGAPENPVTSIRLNGKGKMHRTHSNAFRATSGGPQIVAVAPAGLEERKCLGCDLSFQPKRRWQKFHSEACRLAHWKSKAQKTNSSEQHLSLVV